MRAAVVHAPGPPDVLSIEERPLPRPGDGEIRIRVKAFGVNRSEMFTRQGLSPGVRFPRILGIEAVGVVDDPNDSAFAAGATVATVMGGMGRAFDGSYAEYVVVPAAQVLAVRTSLAWDVLGALPEMLQTAWGALTRSLQLCPDERLLVRGGTSSVGLAAIAIGKRLGAVVVATTRDPARAALLRESGADDVVIETGTIASELRARFGGVDKVLELVGTTTLLDSLQALREHGIVSMTGMVGNAWSLTSFEPMGAVLSSTYLTTYDGGVEDFLAMPFQSLVDDVEARRLMIRIGSVFPLERIADAHRLMEANAAGGKIVVTV